MELFGVGMFLLLLLSLAALWISYPGVSNFLVIADDLITRWGIVSGRVALLPRSTEIQPFVAMGARPNTELVRIKRRKLVCGARPIAHILWDGGSI